MSPTRQTSPCSNQMSSVVRAYVVGAAYVAGTVDVFCSVSGEACDIYTVIQKTGGKLTATQIS